MPAQSLGGAHRDRVCVCVHRDECMRVYMSACVCTIFKKKMPPSHGLSATCRVEYQGFFSILWSIRCEPIRKYMSSPGGAPTDMVVFTAQRTDGSGPIDGGADAGSIVKEPESKKKKPTPDNSAETMVRSCPSQ